MGKALGHPWLQVSLSVLCSAKTSADCVIHHVNIGMSSFYFFDVVTVYLLNRFDNILRQHPN